MTEAPKDQEVPAEDLSDDELQDAGGGARFGGWGDEDLYEQRVVTVYPPLTRPAPR